MNFHLTLGQGAEQDTQSGGPNFGEHLQPTPTPTPSPAPQQLPFAPEFGNGVGYYQQQQPQMLYHSEPHHGEYNQMPASGLYGSSLPSTTTGSPYTNLMVQEGAPTGVSPRRVGHNPSPNVMSQHQQQQDATGQTLTFHPIFSAQTPAPPPPSPSARHHSSPQSSSIVSQVYNPFWSAPLPQISVPMGLQPHGAAPSPTDASGRRLLRIRKPTMKMRETSDLQYDFEKGEVVFPVNEQSAETDTPKSARRRGSARRGGGTIKDDDDYVGYNEFGMEDSFTPSRRSSRAKATPVRGAVDDDEWKFSQCKTLMTKLRRHKHAWPFNQPVDPIELQLPDYLEVVKNPMDLGTISGKLRDKKYTTVQEFVTDVELVWSNCLLYNPPGDQICDWANELKAEFEKLLKQLGIVGGVQDEADGDYQQQDEFVEEEASAENESELVMDEEADSDGGEFNPAAETQPRSRRALDRQRSSARLSAKGSRKYYEESDDDFEDGAEGSKGTSTGAHDAEEEEEEEDEDEEKGLIVARIIAHRVKGIVEENGDKEDDKEKGKGKVKVDTNAPVVKEEGVDYEYFVKWKERSYLHAEWVSGERIEAEGTAGRGKIKRYWKAKQEVVTNKFEMEGAEDELFPPEYTIVDRIIAAETIIVKDDGGDTKQVLKAEKKEAASPSMVTTTSTSAIKEEQKAEAEAVKTETPVEVKSDPMATDEPAPATAAAAPAPASAEQPKTAGEAPFFASPYTVLPSPMPVKKTEWSWDGTSSAPPTGVATPPKPASSAGSSSPAPSTWKPVTTYEGSQAWSQYVSPTFPPPSESSSLFSSSMDESGFEAEEVQPEEPEVSLLPGERLQTRYLVKWCELPYTDCTWELAEDIKDDKKIAEFKRYNTPTPRRAALPRPHPHEFVPLKAPTYKDGNKLRAYQVEGLNWLVFCWYQRRSCILADEMGLGKTAQSICLLEYLFSVQQMRGPFLVVVPLSTLQHWARELETWTDMNVVVYQGNQANRDIIRQYEWYYSANITGRIPKGRRKSTGGGKTSNQLKFNVLLTTYEMILRSDWSELSKINWKCLVVDEAHRLKNRSSKLLEHLRIFKTEHRVILTGTPLQNNTEELWTLLNFIDPRVFPSLPDFLAHYGDLKDAEQVSRLHTVLRPYLLRRLKGDVENSIPPKEEVLVEVELTSLQKKYYRAILEKNRDFLYKGCASNNVPNLINVVMQLRKVCNHPFLINGVEEKEIVNLRTQEEYYTTFIQSTGKLALLDKLLPKLRAGGHKVLIFSQMVRVLDLLESYLAFRSYPYERIDGGVRGNERQAAIDRFSKPGGNRFVFLLCTRAGGLGINLASADTVVIYDSDWNPQNDVQAQARCHRIGQTKEVKVYRLITRNTYERHMFERTSKKLGLDQAVLDNINATSETGKMSQKQSAETLAEVGKEINNLLKFGAYDLYREDENAKDQDMFKEDDVDKILERNSTLIRYDKADGEEGERKSSTFSKAVFQSSEADSGIDVNASNFWELILPEAKDTASVLARLKGGKIGDSEEKQAQFWKDLNNVIEECIQHWEKGPDIPKDLHLLIGVCEDIVEGNTDVKFTGERVQQASKWLAALNPSRKRRRASKLDDYATRSRSQKEEDAYEASESDSDDSSKGRRRSSRLSGVGKDFDEGPAAKRRKLADKQEWTMSERKRVQEGVLTFGRPCWKEIKVRRGLDRRSLAEIRAYALAFLSQCMRYTNNMDDKEMFEDCLNFMKTQGRKYSGKGGILTEEELKETEDDDFTDTDEVEVEDIIIKKGKGKRPTKRRPTRGKSNYPTLEDPQYILNIKRKSKAWAKRLGLLKRLRFELERFDSMSEFELPQNWMMGRKQNPTQWWGPQEDRDLLVGCYKHGFGCFDYIYNDEELCFTSRKMDGEIPGDDVPKATSDQEAEPAKKGKEKTPRGNQRTRGKGRGRRKAAEEDEEEEEDEMEDEDEEAGDLDDMSLDNGGAGHEGGGAGGTGKIPSRLWPMKRVLNLRVKSLMDKIDRLRKADNRQRQRDEKSKQREEKKRSKQDQLEKEREERLMKRKIKQAEKQKKNQERKREWSKRERQDLRVAVMAHGTADWELIKDKARLNNKDVETIEEYFNELLAFAQQMVKDFPNPYSNLKGRKKPRTRGVARKKFAAEGGAAGEGGAPAGTEGDEGTGESKDVSKESEDEEEGYLEVDEEEDEEEEGGSKEKKDGEAHETEDKPEGKEKGADRNGEEGGEEDDDHEGGADEEKHYTNDNPFGITPIVAHRLVDRMKLWTDIRETLLPHPELATLLAANEDNAEMPGWWCPGEHDVALLQGIDKNGIGNIGGEWDEYLRDKDCVFYTKTRSGALSVTRKQRESWLLRFVEDRYPLLERLHHCRCVVLGVFDEGLPDFDGRVGRKRGRSLGPDSYSKAYRTGGRERKRRRGPDEEPLEPSQLAGAASPLPPKMDYSSRVIYRDKSGKPILPLTIKGGVKVLKIGRIEHQRPGFHSKQYLWPIGFESTRRFPSIKNPGGMITYTSRIVDKGGPAPSFEIEAEDMPGEPFCHATSSGVWVHVLKEIKKKASVSVSGPEMFGYSDPVIRKLFQELPNADKCKGYVFRDLDSIASVVKEAGGEEPEDEASDAAQDSKMDTEETATTTTTTTTTTRRAAPTTRRGQRARPKQQQGQKKEDNLQKLVPVLQELGQGLGEDVQTSGAVTVQQLQEQLARLKEKLQAELEDDEEAEEEEEEEEEEEMEGEENGAHEEDEEGASEDDGEYDD